MNTKKAPYRRTAITVPRDVLDAVDRAAQAYGESRSHFISRILQTAVRARRSAAITRRLNELFRDEERAEQDRSEAVTLGRAAIDWSDERW
jgi:hypothetical protein